MADDLVVREWTFGREDIGPDGWTEATSEHNAVARAYLAVVAERDKFEKWYDQGNELIGAAYGDLSDIKDKLATVTAERDSWKSAFDGSEKLLSALEAEWNSYKLNSEMMAEWGTQLAASEADNKAYRIQVSEARNEADTLRQKLAASEATGERRRKALEGVVRVADRKTVEFDIAHAVLAEPGAEGRE